MHWATRSRAPETTSTVLSIISPWTKGLWLATRRISAAHWRRSRLSRSMSISSHSTPRVERAESANGSG